MALLFKSDSPTMKRNALSGAERLAERGIGSRFEGLAVLDEVSAPTIVPLIGGTTGRTDSATAATAEHELRRPSCRGYRMDAAVTDAIELCDVINAVKAFERAAQRLASVLDGSLRKTAPDAPLIAASLRVTAAGVIAQTAAVIEGRKASGLAPPR